MSEFIISGFSDEISPEIDKQFFTLNNLGIKYFEIRGVDGKNVSEISLEKATEVKQKADKYSIRVSSIGSPIGKIGINDDFDSHIKLLEHIIKIAKIFDTKLIRVFSFYIPKDEDANKYRQEVIRRMKKMTELAEKEGVILLHENEKGIYGDNAVRCKDILESVNSPNLRAVFDPANFVEVGQKTYPDAYELLKDYVVYMHIKDAVGNGKIVPSGMGYGHVKEILTSLKKSGYTGFLSLEPHLGHFRGLEALQSDTLDISDDISGPDTFKIAFDALDKILKEL